MKPVIVLGVIAAVCAACWRVSEVVSSDALSMTIGLLFGILSGIPMALMVSAAGRPRPMAPQADTPEPSVIVVERATVEAKAAACGLQTRVRGGTLYVLDGQHVVKELDIQHGIL